MFVIDDEYIEKNSVEDSRKDRKRFSMNNVIFTVPNDYKLPNPLCCPNCEYPMRNESDHISYEQDGCCDFCQTFFVKKNVKKWKDGWRPTKKEIEEIMSSIGMNI